MVLVAGSTGFLGREICRRLRARGVAVRALVRSSSDQSVVAELEALGAETVLGDVKDRASLDAACRGADTVISTVTTTRSRAPGDSLESADHAGQLALVDAAQAAGVKRFVFVSFSGGIAGEDALTAAKRGVEARIRESGMMFTILRPTNFMEVWLGPHLGFDAANAKATIYGTGDNPISFISRDDVAEFAVQALDNPAATNATIELGGPEALSPHQVIRIFERVGGRPFQVQYVSAAALEAAMAAATDSLQRAFASLSLSYARGDVIPMEGTLRQFPIALRSVEEYARGILAGAV
jgi:NADH dehydrogenase